MRNARAWPHNVGRAVQTAPILLRYIRFGDHRTNCWDLLVQTFDSFDFEQQFQTTRNCMQKQTAGCTYGRDMLHPTMLGVVGLQCCFCLHRALHIVLLIL